MYVRYVLHYFACKYCRFLFGLFSLLFFSISKLKQQQQQQQANKQEKKTTTIATTKMALLRDWHLPNRHVIPRPVYKRSRIPTPNPLEEILSEGIRNSSQIGFLVVGQRLGKLVVVKVFPSLLFSLIVIVLAVSYLLECSFVSPTRKFTVKEESNAQGIPGRCERLERVLPGSHDWFPFAAFSGGSRKGAGGKGGGGIQTPYQTCGCFSLATCLKSTEIH